MSDQIELLSSPPTLPFVPPVLPGSPFNWLGYPLTGVSFSTVLLTASTSPPGLQTLVTNPVGSGKRMFLEPFIYNPGAASAPYSIYKSDGTHNLLLNTASVNAGTFGALNYALVLEPGESCALLVASPASLLMSIGVMSFDLSCPYKSITRYVALPAGVTPIYTVPPNTTAFPIKHGTATGAFQNSNANALVFNFDTTPIAYQVLVDGTPTMGPQAPLTNAGLSMAVFPVLTAGQTLALSLSAANAASVTGFYMVVYENSN